MPVFQRCSVSVSSRVILLTTIFLAIFSLAADSPAQSTTSVSSLVLSNLVTPVFSRNGNSIYGALADGSPVVIRNAFQFDEEMIKLPVEFSPATVLAVSYYGGVYAWRAKENSCEVFEFTPQNTIRNIATHSDVNGCAVTRGAANVVERFVYSVQLGTTLQLQLAFGDSVETIWSSEGLAGLPRLESFALNDLNTAVYTVSRTNAGKRILETFYWVPGHRSRVLALPKTAGATVTARDVNNKNQYLLTLKSGSAVFDPAKKKFTKTSASSLRLTANGAPFNSTTLSPIGQPSVQAACFASGALRGAKVQFGAINDERELILLTRLKGKTGLAKVIPFSVQGFPGCPKGR